MTMTRAGFELIAGIIRRADVTDEQRHAMAIAFAAALKQTNPRFDLQRFIAACEVK